METIRLDTKAISNDLFTIRQANQWIESAGRRPRPGMLFDRFWLEGELAICFAATGKGKSVLGVHIAEAIARGFEIEPLRKTLPPQKVLYFDLEQSDKQFEMRYAVDEDFVFKGRNTKHYEFSPNFLRAQVKGYEDFPKKEYKSYGEYFYEMLSRCVRVTEAKVVIIDDLAFLRRGRDRNGQAARLLQRLRELKDKEGLSVLVLARSPTRATMRGMVTLADLEGSAEIAGFADNVFAIGGSFTDPSIRYLKHIKVRHTESAFDETNVPLFRIEKADGNFLSFRYTDEFADERDLMRHSREVYDNELMSHIEDLAGEKNSQREIAEKLRVSKTTVNRYMMISFLEQQAAEELRRQKQEQKQKKEKRLSPAQERDRRFQELVLQDHQRNLERQAAEAAALGLPPPPRPDLRYCEPMTPSSVFRRPDIDDGKCDCTECLAGRKKQCLEKALLTSRSP